MCCVIFWWLNKGRVIDLLVILLFICKLINVFKEIKYKVVIGLSVKFNGWINLFNVVIIYYYYVIGKF